MRLECKRLRNLVETNLTIHMLTAKGSNGNLANDTLFNCECCFGHYVTAVFLIITRYKLLFPDWGVPHFRKERVDISTEELSMAEFK